MSYTQELKEGLLALPMKRPCCKKMWLMGLLSGGVKEGSSTVRLRFHTMKVAAAVTENIQSFNKGNLAYREISVGKNHYVDVLMDGGHYAEALDAYEDGALETYSPIGCPECLNHFMIGAFLSCGTVNAPDESSHLEFRMTPGKTPSFIDRLASMGFTPGVVTRRNVNGVYLKSNQQIEDLMGMMGDTRHALEYLNQKVMKQAKSEDHRITNYEIGNLQKTVNASMKDIRAIEAVKNAGKFGSLSEEIQYSANLRVDNPELSLRELARLHTPSISVAGLCHRMKAIKELAEGLTD